MDNDKLFTLTREQQSHFNRLKAAIEMCHQNGVVFYNNYGTLGALNGRYFMKDAYNDIRRDFSIENVGQHSHNEVELECGEWSDDMHFFQPK